MKILRSIDLFFFAKQDTLPQAIFRILFGGYLMLIFVISYPNWLRFYGQNATMPASFIKGKGEYLWSVFSLIESDYWVWAVYVLALFFTISFTIGYRTRTSTIALFVIYASMIHRNLAMVNGQDQVAKMLLFFGCFAHFGERLSVDAYIRGRSEFKSVWALRLMQLSLAMIYLFAGPSKWNIDEAWRNGTAIYFVSLSERWFRFPEVEIFHNLYFSYIATYGSLFMEVSFPLLVWFQSLRIYMVAGLMLMHFVIMFLLAPSVFYFNLVMIIALILFLDYSCFAKRYKFSRT